MHCAGAIRPLSQGTCAGVQMGYGGSIGPFKEIQARGDSTVAKITHIVNGRARIQIQFKS